MPGFEDLHMRISQSQSVGHTAKTDYRQPRSSDNSSLQPDFLRAKNLMYLERRYKLRLMANQIFLRG